MELIDWICKKLGMKKNPTYLGRGGSSVVYDIGDNKVIKITNHVPAAYYKILNKNQKGFAKVYAIGEVAPPSRFIEEQFLSKTVFIDSERSFYYLNTNIYYIICEKVESKEVSKKITKLINFILDICEDNNISLSIDEDLYNDFNIALRNCKQEIDNSSFSSLFYQLKEVMESVVNFDSTLRDFGHS